MWINEETLKTYKFVHEVRADFPEVSLPPALTDEMLASIGVLPVEQATPGYNPITQSTTELPPALVGGKWVQQWEITDLPQEQVVANLAAARAAKWEAIKVERDRRKVLGVKVGEHWFHSDADSRIQQISLFVMGASVPPVQWKTLTTTPPPVFVTMTQSIAAGIFQATAASDAAVFAAAEVHRVAMEDSDTPETYDISSGWPTSIEDEL